MKDKEPEEEKKGKPAAGKVSPFPSLYTLRWLMAETSD
jgi:hypothetical protein